MSGAGFGADIDALKCGRGGLGALIDSVQGYHESVKAAQVAHGDAWGDGSDQISASIETNLKLTRAMVERLFTNVGALGGHASGVTGLGPACGETDSYATAIARRG